MMELYRKFVAAATESRQAHHDWQHDTPYRQPYYAYSASDRRWRGISPPSKPPATTSGAATATATAGSPPTSFTIYSWNIDFMLPHGDLRLTAALNHIHDLITTATTRSPEDPSNVVIFLQEMTNTDVRVIQAQPWIRRDFFVTDISNEYWESDTFGTCTLISKSLRVRDVFRVHYRDTRMQRDGLFVDIDIDVEVDNSNSSPTATAKDKPKPRVMRLCNTHLESLALEPPMRPAQLRCAARYMHPDPDQKQTESASASADDDTEVEVVGSVLGGDLNAIQDFDPGLAAENGLEDAFEVIMTTRGSSGGDDNDDNDDNDGNGFTWGQMARTSERRKYGLSRMDKLLFCGGVAVKQFARFGMGVEVADTKENEAARRELVSMGLERPWVTDHLGVRGDFSLIQ